MKCLVIAVLVMRSAAAFACASIDNYDTLPLRFHDEECGPYQRWSWAPILTLAGAYSGDEHRQGLVSAELRVRHGRYATPSAWTAGVEVSTPDFSAIASAAVVGYEFIDSDYFAETGDVSTTTLTAVAAGAGYDAARHRAFATARLAYGMLFDVEDGSYVERHCGHDQDPCTSHMQRHRAELELVLEVRVAEDNASQVSLGVAFDPVRIWTEATRAF